MISIGKWITKHKNIILCIAVILLIPSGIGYINTRVNYDVLSYLPKTLETVDGQDILVDEFGMGAFSMVIVEDMPMKDIVALEQKLEKVEHVSDVLWYDDALDISVPTEMMPQEKLNFCVMKTKSLGINQKGQEVKKFPPVPMNEKNVCAYAALHRKLLNI